MEYRGQWRSPCSFHGQLLPVNEHLHLLVPTQPREIPGGNNKKEKKGALQSLRIQGVSERRDQLYLQCTLYRAQGETGHYETGLSPFPNPRSEVLACYAAQPTVML